jgi:hypothetical protein
VSTPGTPYLLTGEPPLQVSTGGARNQALRVPVGAIRPEVLLWYTRNQGFLEEQRILNRRSVYRGGEGVGDFGMMYESVTCAP